MKGVDAKGAVIGLGGDVEGYLRASEVARDRVEDARTHLKEGDQVIGDDHQRRPQEPHHQPLDQGEGRSPKRPRRWRSCRPTSSASAGTTSLGALLKAKLDNKNAQRD